MSERHVGGCLCGQVRFEVDVGIRPDTHVFTSSRAPWDHELEKVASFARLPS